MRYAQILFLMKSWVQYFAVYDLCEDFHPFTSVLMVVCLTRIL
jgi:hypothetical protein